MDEMSDAESVTLHNLLAKYCREWACPGDWDVKERRAFTDLAADLRESVGEDRFTFKKFPDIV
jgi:hypothetical protein